MWRRKLRTDSRRQRCCARQKESTSPPRFWDAFRCLESGDEVVDGACCQTGKWPVCQDCPAHVSCPA
eukprot:5596743-Amphidinium_carterae.1